MPEMAAAVWKLTRLQDLVLVARKIRVVTKFRTTVGLPGRLSTRFQPNHPTDDPAGIAAAVIDELMLGSRDAVNGINPVSDSVRTLMDLPRLIDHARQRFAIPTARLCARPCHHADGGDAVGRAGRSRISVDRDQSLLWRQHRVFARRSASDGARTEAGRGRRRKVQAQHHVLRDWTGKLALR